MSNIYRYKNCLKVILYNCNWDNNLPEIDGHATCIFNVVTRQFRIWLRPKCIDNVWTTSTEITNYSEKTRLYVLNAVEKGMGYNSSMSFPTGVIELTDASEYPWEQEILALIKDNYIGDIDTTPAKLPNLWVSWLSHVKKEIDIGYMLRLLSPHRISAYLKRVSPDT